MANRKLTAGDSAKPPCRRDPTKTPYSSWQQVQRYGNQGRGKDCRDADAAKSTAAYNCSRYGETPNQKNVNGRGSNGGVVAARKSDPLNGCATPCHHNEGKWLCRLFRGCGNAYFRWREGDSPHGTPAPITAAHVPATIRNVHPTEAMQRNKFTVRNDISSCSANHSDAAARWTGQKPPWLMT